MTHHIQTVTSPMTDNGTMIGVPFYRNRFQRIVTLLGWISKDRVGDVECHVLGKVTPDRLMKALPGLCEELASKITADGDSPCRNGYPVNPPYLGMVEIGIRYAQEAWSDDCFLCVRADNGEMIQFLRGFFEKNIPPIGGGVPGSYGYKGSGWKTPPTELTQIYHYSSYGIGD